MSAHSTEEHTSEEHEHPGPKTYAVVAAVLTIITITEVYIFFLPDFAWKRLLLVTGLTMLSAAKFVLVVMFYMHLKYDHPVFRRVLVGGIVIAFGVMLWVLALFTFS
ncbi:MAG: cytochrome C oxidase subunit IV, partial [Gammaproteobacteria bacterium]|nr:cytochrome C oxidase subunit IV [Gammaproteobacteria bacterium]NIV21975.1 cytochrome C oxidase subunit IV [Gammaproteobacteria bacterium]